MPFRRSFALFLVAALSLAGAPIRAHNVAVNADPRGAADVSPLACADTVYVHIAWDPPMSGAHQVGAVWRNETTNLSHASQITTEPNTPASYLWLRFEPGEDGGLARVYAPEAGYDGFAGDWTVRLTLDGQPFSAKRFKIQC